MLLKKRPARKLTKIKFVGVAFDPEKYKAGETEINDALSEGYEVIRDFETRRRNCNGTRKVEKRRQCGENEMEQLKNASADSRKKSLVETTLDIFFRISNVSTSKLLCTAVACGTNSGIQHFNCNSDRYHVFYNFAYSQVHTKTLV